MVHQHFHVAVLGHHVTLKHVKREKHIDVSGHTSNMRKDVSNNLAFPVTCAW